MRILAIGSSRKNGNTERIITLLEQELRRQAAHKGIPLEYEYLPLRDYALSPCKGCRACFTAGEACCPLGDDLLAIREKMLLADGIIIGSPVYVEDINGTLKTFIDRMAFTCHRPQFFKKSAVIFTTSGVGSSSHALTTIKRALGTWAFCLCGEESFRTGALMSLEALDQTYGKRIAALAGRLLTAAVNHKPERPTFYQLLVFKVQQCYYLKPVQHGDEYDHAFWQQNGWLNPRCDYYTKHKANPVKTFLARLVGRIVAVFFI